MVDIQNGHHIYHWKHGWIPLDHTAALSKAKGNHKLAGRYLERAHASGAAHKSFVSTGTHRAGTGAGSHLRAADGFHPVAHEHLRREKNVTVAWNENTRKFHLLDTQSGHSAVLDEGDALDLHRNGGKIMGISKSPSGGANLVKVKSMHDGRVVRIDAAADHLRGGLSARPAAKPVVAKASAPKGDTQAQMDYLRGKLAEVDSKQKVLDDAKAAEQAGDHKRAGDLYEKAGLKLNAERMRKAAARNALKPDDVTGHEAALKAAQAKQLERLKAGDVAGARAAGEEAADAIDRVKAARLLRAAKPGAGVVNVGDRVKHGNGAVEYQVHKVLPDGGVMAHRADNQGRGPLGNVPNRHIPADKLNKVASAEQVAPVDHQEAMRRAQADIAAALRRQDLNGARAAKARYDAAKQAHEDSIARGLNAKVAERAAAPKPPTPKAPTPKPVPHEASADVAKRQRQAYLDALDLQKRINRGRAVKNLQGIRAEVVAHPDMADKHRQILLRKVDRKLAKAGAAAEADAAAARAQVAAAEALKGGKVDKHFKAGGSILDAPQHGLFDYMRANPARFEVKGSRKNGQVSDTYKIHDRVSGEIAWRKDDGQASHGAIKEKLAADIGNKMGFFEHRANLDIGKNGRADHVIIEHAPGVEGFGERNRGNEAGVGEAIRKGSDPASFMRMVMHDYLTANDEDRHYMNFHVVDEGGGKMRAAILDHGRAFGGAYSSFSNAPVGANFNEWMAKYSRYSARGWNANAVARAAYPTDHEASGAYDQIVGRMKQANVEDVIKQAFSAPGVDQLPAAKRAEWEQLIRTRYAHLTDAKNKAGIIAAMKGN